MSGGKKILVLTDFSEPSLNALDYAVAWAEADKYSIHLINVQSIPIETGFVAAISQAHHIQLEAALNRLENLVKSIHTDVEITYNAEFGEVSFSAEEYIKSNDVVCLVMGIKTRNSFLVRIFGSHISSIINSIRIPILLIPMDNTFQPPLNIAYASDRREGELEYVSKIKDLLGHHSNEFWWIYVTDTLDQKYMPSEKTQHQIKELFPQSTFIVKEDENIQDSLAEISEERSIQLVVMRTEQKSLLSRLTTTSVSRSFSNKSPVPLLVFSGK